MKKIMTKIKETVARTSVSGDRWLEEAKLVLLTEDKAVISCRSQFAADIVKNRFSSQIKGVFWDVCGCDPEIITVDEEVYQTLVKRREKEDEDAKLYDEILLMRQEVAELMEEVDFLMGVIEKAEEEYAKLNA